MLENALFALVIFLSLVCYAQFFYFQKMRKCKITPKVSPLEDVFNALPAPVFYKKGQNTKPIKPFIVLLTLLAKRPSSI
jgi:hypothetical protein